jgi:hypothetical protein
MATDAEIEAAVKSMRAIRTRGGKVHDEVLRAYARAALAAAALAQVVEGISQARRASGGCGKRSRRELARRRCEEVGARSPAGGSPLCEFDDSAPAITPTQRGPRRMRADRAHKFHRLTPCSLHVFPGRIA